MNWAAYGLSRDPFQRSAELDDACLPNTVAALLSELLSSLRSPQGVSVLVADSGAGKSVVAGAFARRIGGVAHVAHLTHPTSSVSAIAREALAQFDPEDFDFHVEEDWVAALRARVERCARTGRATAILIDDAHRLSPQTLEDLAELFADDETLRLHVFLFGRPRLLDRMHAGAEKALEAHLLQICRLEPLGVRESVRYLERRFAICGGELAALYNDEAIDEIVQTAEGRMLRLEEVAAEALRRASRRGRTRASVEDVVAMARHAVAEEEEDAMTVRQQPLRFELADRDADGDAVDWNDDETEDRPVEWGDEDSDEDEQWQADEAEEVDEPELTWDTSPHRLDDDALDDDESDGDENDDEDVADEPVSAGRAAQAATRRRLVGPAVLSIGAGLALVWAANHVPGPSDDARHGRDAMLFAEPLTSEPSEIMRLAKTVEAADADAQVTAWRAQPPRPVAKAAKVADRAEATTVAEAVPAPAKSAASPNSKETSPADVASLPQGPPENVPVAVSDSTATAKVGTAAPSVVAKASPNAASAPKSSSTPPKSVASAKRSAGPVFTVQLGAFKARSNAEELVSKLRGKSPHILQEGGLYRVISGSFATKRDAVVHEASLKRAGYTTYVRTAVF